MCPRRYSDLRRPGLLEEIVFDMVFVPRVGELVVGSLF